MWHTHTPTSENDNNHDFPNNNFLRVWCVLCDCVLAIEIIKPSDLDQNNKCVWIAAIIGSAYLQSASNACNSEWIYNHLRCERTVPNHCIICVYVYSLLDAVAAGLFPSLSISECRITQKKICFFAFLASRRDKNQNYVAFSDWHGLVQSKCVTWWNRKCWINNIWFH